MISISNRSCFDVMEEMVDSGEKVDLILTDPPYEYNLDGGCGGFKARLVSERNISFISNGFDYERCFNLFLKIQDTPNILIFCSNNQITKTMKFFEEAGLNVTLLVWHKTNAIPLCNQKHKSDLEFLVYARGSGAYFNNDVTHDKKSKCIQNPICTDAWRFHPAQKPERIINHLVEMHSKEGQKIFDGFMGSGVCGKICAISNRSFIVCEIDNDFYQKAKAHLKSEIETNIFISGENRVLHER